MASSSERYNFRSRSGTLGQIQNLTGQNVHNGIRPRKNTAPERDLCEIKTKRNRLEQDSTPMPSYLPPDVIQDVLKFIERNEVEKCQLLSYNFDKLISKSATLPLYLIKEITFDDQHGSSLIKHEKEEKTIFNKCIKKPLDATLSSLGNCYAERVKINVRGDGEKILEKLEEIKMTTGKPIQTGYCEIIWCNGDYEWFENLPMIFRDFITTQKFNLVFYTTIPFKYVIQNPSCLELHDPKTEINIETANCYGTSFKNAKNSIYGFFAGEKFEKLLNRGTIDMGHVKNERELVVHIIQLLRTSTKLPYLFKKIRLNVKRRIRDDQSTFHELFVRNEYVPYMAPQGRYQDRTRSDGWVIEVDFNHDYVMEFAILAPKEKREGFPIPEVDSDDPDDVVVL